MMNSFSFFLSGKLFIYSLSLNDTFAGKAFLAVGPSFHDCEYFLPIPSSLQSFFWEISWQSYGNLPVGN